MLLYVSEDAIRPLNNARKLFGCWVTALDPPAFLSIPQNSAAFARTLRPVASLPVSKNPKYLVRKSLNDLVIEL